MKIENKIWMASVILATMIGTTSCSDQLSALPAQEKVEGNLIVDAASAQVALNGIYYDYAKCATDNYDIPSTQCAFYQEIIPADFAGTVVYYQGPYSLESHGIASMVQYTSYLWSYFYSVLSAANGVLEQVDKTSESMFTGNRRNEILGEATFMRAFAHYNLMHWYTQFWKYDSSYGLLIRTSTVKAGTIAKDRSTVKESYDCILSDLDYAIANCPDTNPNYYANKWIAKGLKARVLMMRGQGTDYADAAVLCKGIIDNGPYALETNLEDVFHAKGLNSSEVMFGIQPKSGQSDVLTQYYYRSAAQYYPTDNFLALFNNDPRKDWLFDTQQAINGYGQIVAATTICKHMKKALKVASTLEESQYQMRLTEIYLLRAEALVYTSGVNEESKTLLKTILGHAGVTDFSAVDNATTKEELLKQIFNETLRNLFCESGREMDMMMRMPSSIVTAFNPAYSVENTNIMPIPVSEFKYNKALREQNPGYSKE